VKESTSGAGFGSSRPLGRASRFHQPALVPLPGGQVPMRSAGGPLRLGGTPCCPRGLAARYCAQSAAARSPWQVASKDLAAQPFVAGPQAEQHASGPESVGHFSHRPGAARRCSPSALAAASALADRFDPDADPTHALLLGIDHTTDSTSHLTTTRENR
jgi:hypothetical protein